ncbi:MAG: DUF4340 domain-containing protein [Phycisphaeraceae bacterium]|nr:DUF4340 domain-containing protein [Phycisphaeraceae bacterium]
MSKAAVIVALILAMGLGVAALLVTQAGGNPSVAGPLLTFDPASVTELRVVYADGSEQAVVRAGSGWMVVLRTKAGAEKEWPAATTQVHAALRIFANLVPEQPADGKVVEPAGTLRVVAGDGAHELAIGSQRLGGRVLVQAGDRAAWLDASIAEMLIDTGIRAWRSPAALPGLGMDASRISVRGHAGGEVSLARIQGRWALREPFAEPADPEAVHRLLALLAAVRVEDFCDNGAPADTGLDTPAATLIIESDSRDAAGRSTTTRQAVSVGRAADVAGRTVIARLERSGEAAFADTVILHGEPLAAINADPLHYVARRALQVEPSEVGQLIVRRAFVEGSCAVVGFRRTLDGWETRCGEEAWRVASADDVKLVTSLVDLLATTPAEMVTRRGTAEESALSAAATVEAFSLGGTPIGRVDLDVEATRLVSLTDRVRRQYPPGVGSLVAEWLGRK